MTVISDQDVAIEAGARGLHADLMRLSESHDEDISEAACACVAACIAALPEGRGFPAPRASYTTYPAAPYRVRLGDYVGGPLADETRPWLPRDPRWRNADAASVRRAIDTLDSIWVRPIPSSVRRQRGQEDVGHVLWPAAPVLSRWIVAHRALWAPRSCHGCGNRRGVRTLELGAGLGLAGLVAGVTAMTTYDMATQRRVASPLPSPTGNDFNTFASCGHCGRKPRSKDPQWPCVAAPSVTLTDFNPNVVARLSENAALNEPTLNVADFPQGICDALWPRPGGESSRALEAVSVDAASTVEPASATDATRRLFSVERLDWTTLVAKESSLSATCEANGSGFAAQAAGVSPTYDIVIGTDCICCADDARGVAAALAAMMRRPAAAKTQRPSRGQSTATISEIVPQRKQQLQSCNRLQPSEATSRVDGRHGRTAALTPSHVPSFTIVPDAECEDVVYETGVCCSGDRSNSHAGRSFEHVLSEGSFPQIASCWSSLSALPVAAANNIERDIDCTLRCNDSGDDGDEDAGDDFAISGGVGIFLLPPHFTRYGVDALAAALADQGLTSSVRTVDSCYTDVSCDEKCGSYEVTAGGGEAALLLWVVSWPQPTTT